MTTTARKTESHREFIARAQRFNDSLIAGYRNGSITLADLSGMVTRGEITVSRRDITVGAA